MPTHRETASATGSSNGKVGYTRPEGSKMMMMMMMMMMMVMVVMMMMMI